MPYWFLTTPNIAAHHGCKSATMELIFICSSWEVTNMNKVNKAYYISFEIKTHCHL